MTSALETHILAALMYGEPSAQRLSETLQSLRLSGELLICGSVDAELLAGREVTPARLDHVLQAVNVRVDWTIDEAVWRSAGTAVAASTGRRRTFGGGTPHRVLADFVIGAHAASHAAQLVTLDAQIPA